MKVSRGWKSVKIVDMAPTARTVEQAWKSFEESFPVQKDEPVSSPHGMIDYSKNGKARRTRVVRLFERIMMELGSMAGDVRQVEQDLSVKIKGTAVFETFWAWQDRGGEFNDVPGGEYRAKSAQEAEEMSEAEAKKEVENRNIRSMPDKIIVRVAGSGRSNPGRSNPGRSNPGRSNPGRSDVDEHAARELKLFIENDGVLYRQQTLPIYKNLQKKKRSGTFDVEKAAKLFGYLVEAGAKKYAKDLGGGQWSKLFPPSTRQKVAMEFATEFATDDSEY
jgi:hypothetical protein